MGTNVPTLYNLLSQWWGGGTECYGFAANATLAANLAFGTNPPYQISDFFAIYPKFGTASPYTSPIPQPVLQLYINLASASLSQARWLDYWQMGMALFVAHYATLYLRSEGSVGTTAQQIASSGLAVGLKVSQAAGDVSQSQEYMTTGWESWGSWNLTTYGQQLITNAAIVGIGPMYIR